MSLLIKRLGLLNYEERKFLRKNKKIWFHAVSVGEIVAGKRIIEIFKERYGKEKVVVTCVTPTGYRLAASWWKEGVYLLPLDSIFTLSRFLKEIQAYALIILETEIWPQLVSSVKKRNIPVILINGRISDNSFPKYKRVRFFIRHILSKIDFFIMQSDEDKKRIIYLGAPSCRVKVLGNLKYISCFAPLSSREQKFLHRLKDFIKDRKFFLGASTHEGEEEILLRIYRKLKAEFSDLYLILAPRHPERSRDIIKLVKKYNFTPLVFENILELSSLPDTIFVMNKIGYLRALYKVCDICFVGGSLTKIGGHNILEPAYFRKPILSGPYFYNFKDIFNEFLKEEAIIIVKDEEELYIKSKRVLEDDELRSYLSINCVKILNKYKNLEDEYVKCIGEFLHI